MPYLPIDPKDLGRSYDAVIRVNSQSGKGGISYLLETEYGVELPRRLQIEFSQVVQAVMDDTGKELGAAQLWDIFEREYGLGAHARAAVEHPVFAGESLHLSAVVKLGAKQFSVDGKGSGPIDAFVNGLNRHLGGSPIRVLDYHEHAIGSGADAQAAAYLELRIGDGPTLFGVGIDANIVSASLKAIVSGLQRALQRGALRFEPTVPA
jgi:2-isopropylmalate synthase